MIPVPKHHPINNGMIFYKKIVEALHSNEEFYVIAEVMMANYVQSSTCKVVALVFLSEGDGG